MMMMTWQITNQTYSENFLFLVAVCTPCPKKGCHQTHGGNFVKSQPIFKILLPLEKEGNFQ